MDIAKIFGNIVTENLGERPGFARRMVRIGCAAQHIKQELFPEPSLLPSQRYLVRICLRYIRKLLAAPGKSALVNLFMPCELLHAMNVNPMCTEGFSGFLSIGNCESACLQKAEEMGVPDTYCSFHKTLLGAAYTGLIKPPRFVASTNIVCDANYSTFNAIANHYSVPKFLIDVPDDAHESCVAYVTEQLSGFVAFMEDLLGRKMQPERLTAAISNTNRAVASNERFLTALETRYMPTTATNEMNKVLMSHILLGTNEAAEFYERLANDAKGGEITARKRILWSPVMPYGLKSMDEPFISSGSFQLLPTDLHFDAMTELDAQSPLESLAKRLVNNHFYRKTDKRADVLLRIAKRLRADGVVLFCHWGCKTAGGSAYMLRDALQGEGIPAVVLDGDACDRRNMSEGQFSTRLQAFFEILEGVA